MANSIPYGSFLTDVLKGDFNIGIATPMLALATSSYTFSVAHKFISDITGEIPSDGDYEIGGKAVPNPAITLDELTFTSTLTCDPVFWNSINGTVECAILYLAAPSNRLICCINIDPVVLADEPFQMPFPNGAVQMRLGYA